MKRIQLFEFEDFNWLPSTFRSTMTKMLAVLHRVFGTKEVVGNVLHQIRQRHSFSQIVDLGSGSGGPMPMVVDYLYEQSPNDSIKLLLTDLHPNQQFVQAFNKHQDSHISYQSTPLDASNLSKAPKGLKTMISSFHHMPPEIARKILKSAQDNKQPLLIYEMAENNIPTILWALMLPISLPILMVMALVFLPFAKPLTSTDIAFTYLIPIVPVLYAWDGQASIPRIYTFDDIKSSLLPEEDENYTWEIRPAQKKDGKSLGYYILGLPK